VDLGELGEKGERGEFRAVVWWDMDLVFERELPASMRFIVSRVAVRALVRAVCDADIWETVAVRFVVAVSMVLRHEWMVLFSVERRWLTLSSLDSILSAKGFNSSPKTSGVDGGSEGREEEVVEADELVPEVIRA
jgi:hypothetical protein